MSRPAHTRISTLSLEHDARVGRRPRLLCGAVLIALFVTAPAAARAGTIVTGLGAGGVPQVGVFDSTNAQQLYSFLAYGSGFTGGVRVATGDVNGDGVPDIVTGSGPGTKPHVKVSGGRE
jgi:FG-GAP repeat protein